MKNEKNIFILKSVMNYVIRVKIRLGFKCQLLEFFLEIVMWIQKDLVIMIINCKGFLGC